jgi:hypothetical protein
MLRSLLHRNKLLHCSSAAAPGKVLQRRGQSSFERFPPKVGLYDKAFERDSCGVGLVASVKKISSRKIVVDANQMLVRMSHRGACGCDENAGDGAGDTSFDV